MSLQDDIFDVKDALKRKPEAKAFERICQYVFAIEQAELEREQEDKFVEPTESARDVLARLREIAKNNAIEGSQDERDAWTGMSKEIDRALRMVNRAVFMLTNRKDVVAS